MYFDAPYNERMGIADIDAPELALNFGTDVFYSWRASEFQQTGIYEVVAERVYDSSAELWYYKANVKGMVYYKPDAEPTTDFTLYMDASDEFDHTGTGIVDFTGALNVQPQAYTENAEEALKPKYVGDFVPDGEIFLSFNAPVRPTASWICPNPSQFSTMPMQCFPIVNNGDYTISFNDIFGNLYTQEIAIKDTFEDNGLNLSFSTLSRTDGTVEINASVDDSNKECKLLIIKATPDGYLLPSGNLEQDMPSREKSLSVTENGTVTICRFNSDYTYDELYTQGEIYNADVLNIHIGNIEKGAPEPTLHFYFGALGAQYGEDNLPKCETNGSVKVWYTTDRHVTPINGSAEEIVFRYGDSSDSYTFSYVDDFNNEKSFTVDLSELGISLASPNTIPVDNTAPYIMADIYAKRFGNFTAMGSLLSSSAAQEITDTFSNISYVQNYSLKINVREDSDYKTVILNNAPSSLSYASAVSDNVDGVSISGNTLNITKPVNFTVAVVDNAKQLTGASADNYTYLSISAEDMKEWFDNTPPQAEAVSVITGLYERSVYVTFTDKSNNGNNTGSVVTLLSPNLRKETAGEHIGRYKKIFTDNNPQKLIFSDMAGNIGESDIGVTDINTSSPQISIEWSPSYTADGTQQSSLPPVGPLNVNVNANVRSNMPIASVTAKYSVDNINWTDDESVVSGVSWSVLSDCVTVKFSESKCGVRLIITVPNGQSHVETLFLSDGVIDKTSPDITEKIEYKYKTGATVPYEALVTIIPNEPVYCNNSGELGVLYDAAHPLSFTRIDNYAKIYYFTDKAGNHSEYEVITENIDVAGPILTTTPEDTINLPITSGEAIVSVSANEVCSLECNGTTYNLTAGGNQELSFTQNGSYVLTAIDRAGNKTVKTVVIGNIDKTIPKIFFDKTTLSLCQNSDISLLTGALDAGVSVSDNGKTINTPPNYDASGVLLDTPGLYEVEYTTTDEAGNQGSAVRYVLVYEKNKLGVLIDGEYAHQRSTVVVKKSYHSLGVIGLQKFASGIEEPYTVKICKGLYTGAQMKYLKQAVPIDENGQFEITAPGFYTLYVLTQSRQTYLIQLYAEK